jgi:molybdenum cofactor synthesis domain-containing protein
MKEGLRGTVVSVNVSPRKGEPKEPVGAIVIGALGVVGDCHAGPGARQVSLLGEESIRRFEEETGRSLPPGGFAENITTRGLDLGRAAPLDSIEVGGALLEVSQIGKECHGADCAVFREVGRCVMPSEGVFCRVVRGGPVRPGDCATLVERPLRVRVVTLSDRASRGEYEDLSGPLMESLIRDSLAGTRWHLAVERSVLGDDAAGIRSLLAGFRDSGVDAVFTTGGTGVGPRDVTAEVVTQLADKLLPGIMEYIRCKCGAENPRALLSRSVAAVMGSTLIYAVPGSPAAVGEYVPEIMRTFEHLVCMIHGLDVH